MKYFHRLQVGVPTTDSIGLNGGWPEWWVALMVGGLNGGWPEWWVALMVDGLNGGWP